MKNFLMFLKGMFFTLFAAVLLISFTVMIATADTATRTIGFGDSTPALSVERYRDSTDIRFFGNVISVDHKALKSLAEEIKKAVECFVPSSLRLFKEVIENIKQPSPRAKVACFIHYI